ncbi:MAG: hypothetical protein H7X95_09365, partial [Deltaproteobacteria bacterium]|nr:hypothetical protein [Deltaproteobacteria bacterium]
MTQKTLVLTGLVLGLTGASFVTGTAIAKPAAKAPVLSALSEAKWMPIMKEGPLPAMAPIQGDGMKGGYMGYLKLPANFTSPPHSHTSDYWTVVVQGKMTHWVVDGGSEADAKQLTVGDLTYMPGKTDHVSKCFPGADCVMVIMQKGKSDFVPAKVAKADKAAAGGPVAPAAPTA